MDSQEIAENVLRAVDMHGLWVPDPEASGQRLSATGHCLRQQWYQATTPPSGEGHGQGNTWEMKDGDIHEKDLIEWFTAAGYTIEDTQEELTLVLSDGAKVPGHPDGVITAGEGIVEPGLFEAKSMSYLRYVRAVTEGMRRSNPDYWLQVNAYAHLKKLNWGLFAVKAKDSSATKRPLATAMKKAGRQGEFAHPKFYVETFEIDQEAVEEVYARHETVRAAVKSGYGPIREYAGPGRDWHCDWCAFKNVCYSPFDDRDRTGDDSP